METESGLRRSSGGQQTDTDRAGCQQGELMIIMTFIVLFEAPAMV